MARNQYYVDPAINANSGAGTIGDPFGDLQHALNTITRNSTSGDQINIKAGADEILTAPLSLATYGTPDVFGALLFQGYTAVAGDGGKGGINCNGGPVFGGVPDVHFRSLHIHNGGSADLVSAARSVSLFDCEISNTSGNGIVAVGPRNEIIGNHFHDIGGNGVHDARNCLILGNYFKNGTKSFAAAMTVRNYVAAERNIISVSGVSNGIVLLTDVSLWVAHNSILSAGGTGTGILFTSTIQDRSAFSNLVEGFSGIGGIGISSGGATRWNKVLAANAAFNNATNITEGNFIVLQDNEVLASSPFAKSGADTFENRFAYFAPVDVGNVKSGAYPVGLHLSKGAVQFAGGTGTAGFSGVRGINRRLGT